MRESNLVDNVRNLPILDAHLNSKFRILSEFALG